MEANAQTTGGLDLAAGSVGASPCARPLACWNYTTHDFAETTPLSPDNGYHAPAGTFLDTFLNNNPGAVGGATEHASAYASFYAENGILYQTQRQQFNKETSFRTHGLSDFSQGGVDGFPEWDCSCDADPGRADETIEGFASAKNSLHPDPFFQCEPGETPISLIGITVSRPVSEGRRTATSSCSTIVTGTPTNRQSSLLYNGALMIRDRRLEIVVSLNGTTVEESSYSSCLIFFPDGSEQVLGLGQDRQPYSIDLSMYSLDYTIDVVDNDFLALSPDLSGDINQDSVVDHQDASIANNTILSLAATPHTAYLPNGFPWVFDFSLDGVINFDDAMRYRDFLLASSSWCKADQNFDGSYTGADFNAWTSNYAAGSAFADLNGDGMLTGNDFNAWLTASAAGCP